jgi:ribose transport system ATP-binding protein
LTDIAKSYGGVHALRGVTFAARRGEVVGLIGENGAGKSTLMKVLGGVVVPSSGTLAVAGRAHKALTVSESLAAGIAFVHQELNLFDNLDVAANVFIGREPVRGGPLRLIDRKALSTKVRPLLTQLGVDFYADTPVSELSLAQRQLLEIVKALSLDAKIVIMDEPTSSLTITETNRLLAIIAGLKARGVGVIFISHRLNEVEQCASRVVVLRDGLVVGTLEGREIRHDAMIRLMVGRDLKALYRPPKPEPEAGRKTAVLELDRLRTAAYPERAVTLALHAGEILGVAGLVGSGRTEIARAVFGVDPPAGGGLRLEGAPFAPRSPREAIDRGLYLVPEDRKRMGLILVDSIEENVVLPNLVHYAWSLIVDRRRTAAGAETQRRALRIKAPDVATPAAALSGGNQQKIVLAKWLSMRPKVIIFDEPTRGVDVGAKTEIYDLMRALADAGVAILMISSDMEEVIGVSDRMAVMHEGAIGGFLERDRFTEENVMLLAVGKTLADAVAPDAATALH